MVKGTDKNLVKVLETLRRAKPIKVKVEEEVEGEEEKVLYNPLGGYRTVLGEDGVYRKMDIYGNVTDTTLPELEVLAKGGKLDAPEKGGTDGVLRASGMADANTVGVDPSVIEASFSELRQRRAADAAKTTGG